MKGDELMSFNGEPVPVTGAPGWIGGFLRYNGERPVTVVLQRDGVEQTLVVNPVVGCAIPIDLEINADANAAADPKKIVVQSGILRITQTDADGLIGEFGGTMIDSGFLLGGIYTGRAFSNYLARAGTMAFSVGFEREADYVGAYYAARAGYDISGAENVWRTMALEHPDSIRLAKTHPTSPERFLFLQKVTTEIADKKSRNLPLAPELKVSQVQPAPATMREDNF